MKTDNSFKINNNLILHLIVGLGDGGAEATLFKLICAKSNFNHLVVSLTDMGKYGKMINDKGVPVHSLGFNKYSFNFFKILKLIKIMNSYHPIIIKSWMYHANFITIFLKILFPSLKIIWGIRNSTYRFKDSKSRFIISKICSYFSYFIPNSIVSCSNIARLEHIKFGYSKKNFDVIYNGVDLNLFKNKNTSKSKKARYFQYKNINEKSFNFGVIARYDKQKGYNVLLNSLFNLKKNGYLFKCIFVGKNVDNNNIYLKSLIKKLGLNNNVILMGQKKDTVEVYNLLDFLILPSINGEGFPNVLIEAMACHVPCIATDVGESKFIIDDTGWIAKPNDIKSLTSTIEKAIFEYDNNFWQTRKKNCRNRVEKYFSLNLLCNNFQNIWEKYK